MIIARADHNTQPANRVVAAARSWLGTPYLHQGSVNQVGCDCLGLIRGVWRELLGDEPQRTPAYSSVWSQPDKDEPLLNAGRRHFVSAPVNQIATGDVILFRMRANAAAKHAAIVSAEHHFIHAYEGNAVVESAFSPFWRQRIVAAFRYPLKVSAR